MLESTFLLYLIELKIEITQYLEVKKYVIPMKLIAHRLIYVIPVKLIAHVSTSTVKLSLALTTDIFVLISINLNAVVFLSPILSGIKSFDKYSTHLFAILKITNEIFM